MLIPPCSHTRKTGSILTLCSILSQFFMRSSYVLKEIHPHNSKFEYEWSSFILHWNVQFIQLANTRKAVELLLLTLFKSIHYLLCIIYTFRGHYSSNKCTTSTTSQISERIVLIYEANSVLYLQITLFLRF